LLLVEYYLHQENKKSLICTSLKHAFYGFAGALPAAVHTCTEYAAGLMLPSNTDHQA